MLCCVPKRLANGGPFYDEAPFHDGILFHDGVDNSPPSSVREIRIELFPEEDAPPSILLPCAICARTFMPQSLEKHARICERAAVKRRKPFDSARQRIQGTELAEFLPKTEVRRHHQAEGAAGPTWKKTHDDFLRTIREARGEVMDPRKQCNSLISSGAPTRANEKGTCPTCNRQFGIKAYDRHVAWCKDRLTRVPVSPATNLAKERLEARMRYRAPTVKNRRAINREKYSPGTANQAAKTSLSSPALVKPKENISVANCNRESPVKQKPAILRRPGQLKESPTSSGPMKSRLADRMNRPAEDHDSVLSSTSCRSFHLALSSRRPLHFPVPSARPRINDPVPSNEITSPVVSSRKQFDRNEKISQRAQNDDARNREACSTRMQKNIVSARSQGHPRINDVAVNDKSLGVTVQPCRIHTDTQKDDQLVTWKQISRKRDNIQVDSSVNDYNFSREFQLLDLDRRYDRGEENESGNRAGGDSSIAENNFTRTDDESENGEVDKVENNNVTWLDGIQNLNQTYLIKDSDDIEPLEIFHSKWKPIKHSPRVEFYYREDEIYEFDQEKLKRETAANNEVIMAEQVEKLKVDIKHIGNGGTVVDCKVDELKISDENIEDNRKTIGEETEVTECEMEELNTNSRDEEDKQRARYKETKATECNVKKIEINTEDKRDIKKIDVTDIEELDKLRVSKQSKENRQAPMDKKIIESMRYNGMKEIERNLLDPDQLIKSSTFGISVHPTAQDVSKKYEKSYSKDSKVDFANDNNYFILDKESSYSKHEDLTVHPDDRDSAAFSDSFVDQNQDHLNLKVKIPQCENNTRCNNSFELKESIVTFICDQSKINDIIPLNNSNNQTDCNLSPEGETLLRQSNIRCNLLDLTENIKEVSSSVSCRTVSLKRNCVKSAEETEINEERYENDLITHCNKEPERNSKRLNSEVYSLPRNSKIATDNYLNAPLRVEGNGQFREKDFSSDNFENIENNMKDGKADFNADSGNSCSDDKSRLLGRSIIKTEVTTGEGLNVDSEFDYGSDNTAHIGERNARGANDLGSSVMLTDNAEEKSRCRGDETVLSMNFPKRATGATRRAAPERPINPVAMKRRIRESMNLLRGSTDSLISSVEFVELASIRRPEANCAYERETIEIIRPSRRSRVPKGLPDIRDDAAEMREDPERSYWERASKISRSKLIDLDPAYHAEYKLAKRNPRVRILPPVPNPSLINRRKIELETRPAWCNYVRRRPDFNLMLNARTGTGKDYDPFLLAEQQMNDLLSDTSDQSVTGSPKLQQTRDTLYPLSHSSAFVKYPPSDKRSSLIAPPTEFDDLMSNFSSDSTETNSISREVFLKPDLAGKDATDSATPKPVRELGRRVIIDKSKALGVDERRGVVVSADRSRKIFDKDTTRPLIKRSGSIRVSSAPRINTGLDRKISSDARKVQGSKVADGQRSSDQNLNQRNNNYSSLSGSNLSLSSIVSSSELDVKRSNSMFDELMTSFEEDTFPGLRSFLNNESFDLSSPGGDRQRNGSLISDEELSSPDSYKPQDHSKLSNDSAYSSLNRKYSHHGRSANDVIDRLDEDAPRNRTSPTQTAAKCKMSKFCHLCGQRFPETAKFCCECGVKRLAL